MSSSEDDLSTTSGSVTDSDEESAGPSDKGLDSTRASAREEFQRMTRETDAKNAALQRDGGSSDSESSSTADSDDGAPPQKGRSESKAADSSGSDSETESSVSVGAASPSASGSGGRVVQGQHHDEELEMSSDTVDTTVYNQQKAKLKSHPSSALKTASGSSDSESTSSDDMSAPNVSRDDMPTNEYEGLEKRPTGPLEGLSPSPTRAPKKKGKGKGSDSDSSSSTDDSDSDSDSDASDSPRAGSRRKNYDNLRVSAEIKELFKFVSEYEPQTVDLPTVLKPFIPDYIPSIGIPDVFVKMDRPDGKHDRLGMAVLDEPASQQTDKDIFEMQLRSNSKVRIRREQDKAIPCIENADKKTERITQWIDNIDELHASRPAPSVSYSHPMPDMNDLMRVWPEDFEQYLAKHGIQFGADLDVDLAEFAEICCSFVDIPVHRGSMTESLHYFFTLWSEFRANQHFVGAGAAQADNAALFDSTDYRMSTPEAIEAAMMQSDHRPTTADGIRQAMENSMKDQRPSTSTHVKHITGNYRPDTAAAIEAVQQMERMETNGK